MTFFPGDILIKVDCRSTADTCHTQHHVMLVLGRSDSGFPIVAHMLGNPHFKLMKETLTRGKDLELIHCPWSSETRNVILEVAKNCCESNKFFLTDAIVQQHREQVSPFRPDCSLDSQKKLVELESAFYQWEAKGEHHFEPNPPSEVVMSCHEWVLSVIYYACQQTKQPLPPALRIPPHLAWADRLHHKAIIDSTVTCVPFQSRFQQAILEEPILAKQKETSVLNSQPNFNLFQFFSTKYTDKVIPTRKVLEVEAASYALTNTR